ncbi:MAG: hypothetical protein Tsb009_18170 [Planctomycetaceae bacterium]
MKIFNWTLLLLLCSLGCSQKNEETVVPKDKLQPLSEDSEGQPLGVSSTKKSSPRKSAGKSRSKR